MEATTGPALPNLTDPEVSKRSLLLGFAYSLCADGSAGKYNKRIAESIPGWLQRVSSPAALPQVAIQWKIRDALGESYSSSQPIGAGPPDFEKEGVLDADSFVHLLQKGETAGARELAKAIRKLPFKVGYESDGKDENTGF
jgi:hypothetical protein